MRTTSKVIVPQAVYQALREMEQSKSVDMHNYQTVLAAMERSGNQAASAWLHDNAKIYQLSLSAGMEPAE